MKKINLFILIVISMLSISMITETKPDYGEILKKADFYRGGQVPGIAWYLEVDNVEEGKLKNELTLKVESSAQDGQQFNLINFLKPKKYSGQKMLLRDNNMWFMKPGMRRPIPISGRQRLTGTASNADVATTNYFLDYKINSVVDDTVKGQKCYKLDLIANTNLVSYSQIKYWISKDKNQGLKAEYYGKSGKLIKIAFIDYDNKATYENKEYNFVSKITIIDAINKQNKTIIAMSLPIFKTFSNSNFQKNSLMD